MSINTSETISTSHNIDIDKYGEFYQNALEDREQSTSCSITRNRCVLILFTILNVFIGIATTVSICLTVFLGTEWKNHATPRKVLRAGVVSLHFIVLPMVSIVYMWITFYKEAESDGCKCVLHKCIRWCRERTSNCYCSCKCINRYEELPDGSKCCSCNWIKNCAVDCSVFHRIYELKEKNCVVDCSVFHRIYELKEKKCVVDCSVFHRVDGLEENTIPEIASISQKNDVQTDQEPTPDDANKIYCNFGRSFLILLLWIIPILYFAQGVCHIVGASIKLANDKGRQPTETFTKRDIDYEKFYSWCTIGFYPLSFILLIPILIHVINVYFNVMYKTAWLSKLLMKSYQNNQLKEAILHVLKFFQSSVYEIEAGRKLFWANIFSSVYILNVVLYDAGYILYLVIHGLTHDTRRWVSIGMLSASGCLLLIIMVITNTHVEKLKSITLLITSIFEISKQSNAETPTQKEPSSCTIVPVLPVSSTSIETQTQQSPLTSEKMPVTSTATHGQNNMSSAIYDPFYLKTIMNYFEWYATIFGYTPHLTALLVMFLAQVGTVGIPFILKAHNVTLSDESVDAHLNIY